MGPTQAPARGFAGAPLPSKRAWGSEGGGCEATYFWGSAAISQPGPPGTCSCGNTPPAAPAAGPAAGPGRPCCPRCPRPPDAAAAMATGRTTPRRPRVDQAARGSARRRAGSGSGSGSPAGKDRGDGGGR